LIGGLILALTFGDPEITFGDGTVSEFSFDEISEIPTEINETAGSVIIDLSDVDFSSVDTVEERVELDINIEFGDLTVLLPEDVRVDVSADSFLGGDLTVFDQQAEGFSPELDFSEDDPQLILDIEVDSGKLTVKREISFTE